MMIPSTTDNLPWFEHAARMFNPSPNEHYRSDPAAWAADKLDARLWSKQTAIATSVTEHRRTAVHSRHGAGKS